MRLHAALVSATVIVGAFLALAGNGMAASVHDTLTWSGPNTCLACHTDKAFEVHGSVHYQWSGDPTYITNSSLPRQGKAAGAVNAYCVNILGNWKSCSNCHVGLGAQPSSATTQDQLGNIDCLVCHQSQYKRVKVNGVFVPDTANMSITMDQAVRQVHKPQRANCLQCHAKGGGGDGYKRGDLALAHTATRDRSFDVHMATTGANLSCQSCHKTSGHRIAGRGSDLRPTDLDATVNCSTSVCHPNKATSRGHKTTAVNKHVAKVACQTCHISVYARNASDTAATEATETHRDWRQRHLTLTGQIHPTITLQNNLKPVYRFWNRYSEGYSLGDTTHIDPVTGYYLTSQPVGGINDLASKLYPFKFKTAAQPLATALHRLIALDTSIYFATGNYDAAVKQGLINMGFNSGEPYTTATTAEYQLITHEVRPSSQALTCTQCHGSSAPQMNLKELGYAPKDARQVICSQCHTWNKEWANKDVAVDFYKLHKLHVTEKRYDCAACHGFTRKPAS